MEFFLRNRRIVVGLLALVSLALGLALRQLKIDFSFDRFYPRDNPEWVFYQDFKQKFPHEDNWVQVALKPEQGSAFQIDFLREVDSLFEDLAALPHVDTVISPTRLQVYQRAAFGISSKPLFELDEEDQFAEAEEIVRNDSIFYYNFFSEDKSYVSGLVFLDPAILDKAARDTLSDQIEALAAGTGYENVVAGIPYFRSQYVKKIGNELKVFIGSSVILTLVVLFLMYRSLWGVLIPLVGVGLSLVWCLGFMGLTGKPVDMMIELLPPILFVVAISDIIHLITKYQQELAKGLSREEAMRHALHEIGAAILLTSLTTAIGFGSLLVAEMPPIRDFGLYSAAGVVFAWLIAVGLTPSFLMRVPKEQILKNRGLMNLRLWDRLLAACHRLGKRRPGIVGAAFGLLILLSLWGMSRISFDTYLLDDISHKDPIRKSLEFYEQNFSGMRPFEMQVVAQGDHSLTDLAVLQELEGLQAFLRRQTKMSPFLSPTNFVKAGNQLYRGGDSRFYELPKGQQRVDDLVNSALATQPKAVGQVLTPAGRTGRLAARMGDIGTERGAVLIASLEAYMADSMPPGLVDYHLTGTAILTDMNVDYLRKSLFTGLLLAFGLIAGLMGLLFRSWRMLWVGILPNIIPLMVTAGLMGFMGISLKASTSIIFLISFGIAVDDTIHFLSRLRLELGAGADIDTAIRRTIMGTGRALVLTTLILLMGFVLLLFSDFGGTFAVGLFSATTLLVALFSDLLLLPVLVRASGLRGKKSKG